MKFLLRAINVWTGLFLGAFLGFIFVVYAGLNAEYGTPKSHFTKWAINFLNGAGPLVAIAVGAMTGVVVFHLFAKLLEQMDSNLTERDALPIAKPREK